MIDAVGISCLDIAPAGIARVAAPARHCTLVGLARRGESVWASSDDIDCPIARHVLGCDVAGRSAELAATALVESKLARNPDAARRLVAGFPALAPQRRIFAYFPADAASPPADVVIRFLHPEDAMRLVRALVTAVGERADAYTAGSAAMCSDCTAAPLLTGRAALSAGCPVSRREVPLAPDEVLVALPSRLERAIGAVI